MGSSLRRTGGGGKRVIDYGVLFGDVEIRGRQQEAGVGVTHDRVVYEVNMGKPPRQCRWGPTVELEMVPPAEKERRWRAEWRSKGATFWGALAAGCTEEAAATLSKVIEASAHKEGGRRVGTGTSFGGLCGGRATK